MPSPHPATDSTPLGQFHLAIAIYAGWSILAWISHITGVALIPTRAGAIVLFGVIATNGLFFMIACTNTLQRPPADTIALAQCVVGIAWATLFSFMTAGTGELVIGIYASIALFALLRVSYGALNQIAVFSVIGYSIVSLVKALSSQTPFLDAASIVPVLILTGIMSCISLAGRHAYRRNGHLETELARLQANMNREHGGAGPNSVSRRYILDLLTREKGRTDRSNVPFCICVLNVDHITESVTDADDLVKTRAMTAVESIVRRELREMDSLSSTGFHDCFGPYSDREYVAILPQTNLIGAECTAKRVLSAVSTQRADNRENIKLSGGIAEYRRGEAISSLLARAEDALGEARESNSSRVCSSERPETHQADIVRLETRRT